MNKLEKITKGILTTIAIFPLIYGGNVLANQSINKKMEVKAKIEAMANNYEAKIIIQNMINTYEANEIIRDMIENYENNLKIKSS